MKNRNKFTVQSKYLLGILTVLCIACIVVSYATGFTASGIRTAAGYVIIPVQKGINEVGLWFSTKADDLKSLREVMKENDELKTELDDLTIENNSLQQDKYELERLRELYQLDQEYKDYKKVGARIIGKEPGNWFHMFLIDKGTNDGISIDSNVIAGSGLVGKVVDVSADSATVRSIIDDTSNVSGTVLSTSDNCTVNGNLELMQEGVIQFEQMVDSDNNVQNGDKVITSNISDKFLPGILIGYISQINDNSNKLTKSGLITPAVDFEHLEEVLVILDKK